MFLLLVHFLMVYAIKFGGEQVLFGRKQERKLSFKFYIACYLVGALNLVSEIKGKKIKKTATNSTVLNLSL